jgi:uncharacterized protein YjbI with pentapeptide repeats
MAGRISTLELPAGRIARQNGANQLQEGAMAERERPANWEDWKWLHRWPRLTSIEWALEWLVYWCKGLAIFELLEVIGRIITVASVAVAVFLWWREADERKKQNHYRAWELINSARGSTGDGGRRDALQDLNEDGVNMADAPLTKAYLSGVELPKARLDRADLSETNLISATLSNAILSRTNLSRANLTEADLTEADLSMANLTDANLTKANLSRVVGDNIFKFELPQPEAFRLSGAELPELPPELLELRMSEADRAISEADRVMMAEDINLSGVNLSKANLTKANLIEARLFGANLSGAILNNGNLSKANLTKANLSGANLFEANLSEAHLSNANLSRAFLGKANLSGADLTKANLENAQFCRTSMPDGTLNNRDCPPFLLAPPSPSETPPAPN